MTVLLSPDGSIELSGSCPNEDAEDLVRELLASPGAHVDWRMCEMAHTAVIQVLLKASPRMVGPPAGATLRLWVAPLLTAAPK